MSNEFGAEIENEFRGSIPAESIDEFCKVSEREDVIGKTEEVGFDGAFIEERQDLILIVQMVGGEQAPFDSSGLAVMGKHAGPLIDALPCDVARQRYDFEPFRCPARYGGCGRRQSHQAVRVAVSPSYFESVY